MFCTRVPLVIILSFSTICYMPREPKFCGKPTHITLESKMTSIFPFFFFSFFIFSCFAYSLSSIFFFIFNYFLLSFIVIRPQKFKTKILDLIIVIIFLYNPQSLFADAASLRFTEPMHRSNNLINLSLHMLWN